MISLIYTGLALTVSTIAALNAKPGHGLGDGLTTLLASVLLIQATYLLHQAMRDQKEAHIAMTEEHKYDLMRLQQRAKEVEAFNEKQKANDANRQVQSKDEDVFAVVVTNPETVDGRQAVPGPQDSTRTYLDLYDSNELRATALVSNRTVLQAKKATFYQAHKVEKVEPKLYDTSF